MALLHKVTTPIDGIPLTCSSACQILGKVAKLFSTIKTYDSKPFQAIPEAIDILKLFREFFKSQHPNIKAAIILTTLEYLSSDIRIIQFFQEIALLEHDSVILRMILEQLLANFGDSVEVLSWVHYQAEFSSNQSLRISATEKLSDYCEGDVATFELLCRIAMNDSFSHDHNFMDDDILWELWRKEGLSLWQKNPRLISLEAIVTHYPDHDKTFSLLENRAVKDPDPRVREFALDAIARRY